MRFGNINTLNLYKVSATTKKPIKGARYAIENDNIFIFYDKYGKRAYVTEGKGGTMLSKQKKLEYKIGDIVYNELLDKYGMVDGASISTTMKVHMGSKKYAIKYLVLPYNKKGKLGKKPLEFWEKDTYKSTPVKMRMALATKRKFGKIIKSRTRRSRRSRRYSKKKF